MIADPICSSIISILIFLSALPLLYQSANVLLQRVPPEMEDSFNHALGQVTSIEGVLAYKEPHLWNYVNEQMVASLHLQVAENVDEQAILQRTANILMKAGVQNASIQINKETHQ
eukprot:TRINITY_DN5383_c0_g2_i1.p3 TRINITY_DN5383_c0_g2~~TRINITY_DN5383_c0_g2_i1.p3  ORF type:complete len:115 (+),score=30.87 TRINITY_DN5383_c0_g2_i1:656-1000(+)